MNTDTIIKFLLSFVLGVAGAWLCAAYTHTVLFSVLVGWNLFGLTYVTFSIYLFASIPQERIRERCEQEDVRSWALFLLIVLASLAGLVTVVSFYGSLEVWRTPAWLNALVGIGAIFLSWMMVHASFAFRYAHLFYGDARKQFSEQAKGLTFPDDDAPDYFDFAYFSFVIGMTFQVSDVVITAKGIRRLALLHSLIAFIFNTVIIAVTIGEIANLK